jgi:murein L,D-transpeptidase YafK
MRGKSGRGELGRRELICGLAGTLLLPAVARADAADRILVMKAARTLQLLNGERVLASYPIALGSHPIGPKRELGDGRTPEGAYLIDGRNPSSLYHLALHISYPDAGDLARARRTGVDPGGDICIHGLPEGYEDVDPKEFSVDWTRGCIAVSDRAMEEIWSRVELGTPIEIRA